jgi:hypothetical protein
MLRMELLCPYWMMLLTYLICCLVVRCLYLKVLGQRRIGCYYRLNLLWGPLMNNALLLCIIRVRVWRLLNHYIRLLIHYI